MDGSKESIFQNPAALMPMIEFDPEDPNNVTLYLINKLTGEILVYDRNGWKRGVSEELRLLVCGMTEKGPNRLMGGDPAGDVSKNKNNEVNEINNNQLPDGEKFDIEEFIANL